MKRLIVLFCSVLLSACGALESLGELQAQSSAAERAIEKDLGIKPFVGWHYHNGTFTSVEVTFESRKLPNMSVADLQAHVWAAVAASFKETPEHLVVAVSSKPQAPNYSVKWTAATCHGNLTPTVAAATYLKRWALQELDAPHGRI